MQICDVSCCRSRRGIYVPINALTAVGALRALMILLCLTPDDFTRQWGTLGSERVNNVKNCPH